MQGASGNAAVPSVVVGSGINVPERHGEVDVRARFGLATAATSSTSAASTATRARIGSSRIGRGWPRSGRTSLRWCSSAGRRWRSRSTRRSATSGSCRRRRSSRCSPACDVLVLPEPLREPLRDRAGGLGHGPARARQLRLPGPGGAVRAQRGRALLPRLLRVRGGAAAAAGRRGAAPRTGRGRAAATWPPNTTGTWWSGGRRSSWGASSRRTRAPAASPKVSRRQRRRPSTASRSPGVRGATSATRSSRRWGRTTDTSRASRAASAARHLRSASIRRRVASETTGRGAMARRGSSSSGSAAARAMASQDGRGLALHARREALHRAELVERLRELLGESQHRLRRDDLEGGHVRAVGDGVAPREDGLEDGLLPPRQPRARP